MKERVLMSGTVLEDRGKQQEVRQESLSTGQNLNPGSP
jgi:hypothetical protein